MAQSKTNTERDRPRGRRGRNNTGGKAEARYTVGLDRGLAQDVQQYAHTVDLSMSKAIAALVRLGLEGQEMRKREFFNKLKANLANDDPKQRDRLVDEFRSLILGR